ncbi:MAG: TonB-dependent receptor [Gammaproteobacteria bacterium]|nr:TonB-dependent receptor [Gammaproteobacteria bacterium]
MLLASGISEARDVEVPAELSTVISTAARVPQNLTKATAPVLVISRAEIERSQAGDLAELLRFYAGIELGRNGGPGQNAGLFLRGTESNHTLVLVDGVEINPGTLGGAAIQNIRPEVIERIEIVKGPRSALWGSEAIGGVLNIITRNAEDGLAWSASAGHGKYDTRSASVESRLRGSRGGIVFGLANVDTDGFPTRSDSETDRAHRNTTLSFKADTAFGGTTLAARYWEARGETEYLDFFLAPVQQDFVNSVAAAEVGLSFRDNWLSELILSQTRDEIVQLDSDDYVSTDRIVANWQNTVSPGSGHTLLAGVSVGEERTQSLSFGSFFADKTRTRDVYLSDFVEFAEHRLLVSARHSHHDGFGSAFTWNVEPTLQIDDRLSLSLGIGTAYRAPDGTDRFGFGGNPDLRPERARNTEIGLHFELGRARLATSVFQNKIDDLIEFVFDPVTFEGGNINVGRARISGIEVSYELVAQDWRWRAGAIVQNPENLTDGTTLARRSKRSLSTSFSRTLSWGELGLDVLASESRRDSPFSDIVNAGYVLANVTARVDLSRRMALRMRLENLLNSRYETAAGFNSPGRGLMLSLSYTSP